MSTGTTHPEPARPDRTAPTGKGVTDRAGAEDLTATDSAGSLRWSPLAFGVAIEFAAVVVSDSIAASPGEPGWLRWLRVFADHPIRGALAASLLFIALSPQSRHPLVPLSQPRGGRDGSSPG